MTELRRFTRALEKYGFQPHRTYCILHHKHCQRNDSLLFPLIHFIRTAYVGYSPLLTLMKMDRPEDRCAPPGQVGVPADH